MYCKGYTNTRLEHVCIGYVCNLSCVWVCLVSCVSNCTLYVYIILALLTQCNCNTIQYQQTKKHNSCNYSNYMHTT